MTALLAAEPAFTPFALERWFAAQPRDARYDLSPSGAMPLTLDELLALASPREREEFSRTSLGYGPPEGTEGLRSLIAERYDGVCASDVLVTCGAIEGLRLAVSAIVAPGDEVIVQRPMYPAAAGMARLSGARIVSWDFDERRGHRADLAKLAELVGPSTRLVAITQPNNPTGATLDDDELDALVERLDAVGAWLLSDEVYRELAIDAGPTASAAGRYGRAIVVGDVTKPFGLGGLRIGWLTTPDARVRERIRAHRDYTTLSVPTPSDALARIALGHSAELLAGPLAIGRENLNALRIAAARDHVLTFIPPSGGLTAFVRVEHAETVQRRLNEIGIVVVPGELFGSPGHLRIWLGGAPADFAAALRSIEDLLADS